MSKNANKFLLIIISLGLCLVSIFLFNYSNSEINNKHDAVVSDTNSTDTNKYGSNGQNEFAFSSLDKYVKHSSNIIIGQVKDIDDFNEHTAEYIVEINNQIKGTTKNRIHLYETKGSLELGGDYLLFLESYNSQFVSYPLYNTVGGNSIVQIFDDTIKAHESFTKETKLSTFLKDIKSSNSIDYKHVIKDSYINQLETNDLIESSDYIARIVPTSIITENKNVKLVKVEILDNLKNNLSEEDSYLLPSHINLNEEYLVFFKGNKENIKLTTRNNSVISKSSEKWNEIILKINKK